MSVDYMTSAATVAHALGGRGASGGFLCRCPVPSHGRRGGDRNPSLSVRDGDLPGRVLFHCFAGCDTRDIIEELRRRGLLDDHDHTFRSAPKNPRSSPPPEHKPDPEALTLWVAARNAGGSTVETYLRRRAITLSVPPSIRCGSTLHAGRIELPVMVAAAQRPDGKIVAVQTTLLTLAGKKVAASCPRITTGALGFGAVRFAKAVEVLGLAEGCETALSAMQLTGIACWSALGAARMHRVEIPAGVRELHVFADADDPGRAAAERTVASHKNRRVIVRFPPDGFADWNDVLQAQAGKAAA